MYLKHLYQSFLSLHDPVHVERFQHYFGLHIVHDHKASADDNDDCDSGKEHYLGDKKYLIKNYLWYYLFSFGSRLGYELFYAISFPSVYWNLDSNVCRKFMFVWAILMYIGQSLKDIIQIPRPRGKNLLIMEPQYSHEFGMPSTHAMLGLMGPVVYYNLVSKRYLEPASSPTIFAICSLSWCLLICLSRLYLGMHSVLDIVCGLLLTSILLIPVLTIVNAFDYFLVRHWLSPLFLILALIILSLIYPKSNNLSPSRADTITIIASSGGVYLGTWLNYYLGIIQIDVNFPQTLYSFAWPNNIQIAFIIVRTIIGLSLILLARTASKLLASTFVKLFTGMKNLNEEKVKHQTIVEVPIKLIQYLSVGLTISFFAPFFHRLLSVDRKSMAFEA